MKTSSSPASLRNLMRFLTTRSSKQPSIVSSVEPECEGDVCFPESHLSRRLNSLIETVEGLAGHIQEAEQDRIRSNYITRNISDAYVSLGINGQIKDLNPAFLKVFNLGYLLEELEAEQVLSNSDVVKAAAFIQKTLKGSESGSYQETIVNVGINQTRYLEVFKITVESTQGREVLFLIKDITDQKLSSKILDTNEKALKSLVTLRDDIARSRVKNNQSVLRMLSLSLYSVSAATYVLDDGGFYSKLEEFHSQREKPNLLKKLEEHYGLAILNKVHEVPYLVLENPEKPFSFFLTSISLKGMGWGFFLFLFEKSKVSQLTDLEINATLAAKEIYEATLECEQSDFQLMSTTELHQQMLNEMPVPVYVRDSDGNYLSMSSSFQQLLGNNSRDVTHASTMSPSMVVDKAIDREMLSKQEQTREYPIQVQNISTNESREGLIRKTAVQALGGGTYIISAFYDLTRQIAAERSVETSSKKVGALLELFHSLNGTSSPDTNIKRFLKMFCEMYGFSNAHYHVEDKGRVTQFCSHRQDWTLPTPSDSLVERVFSKKFSTPALEFKNLQNIPMATYNIRMGGITLGVLSLVGGRASPELIKDPEFLLVLRVLEVAATNLYLKAQTMRTLQ